MPALSFRLRDSACQRQSLAPSAPIRNGILQSFLCFLFREIQKASSDIFRCKEYSTMLCKKQEDKHKSADSIKNEQIKIEIYKKAQINDCALQIYAEIIEYNC